VLVRTWNLFNGNTFPPRRKAYLRQMVELISADKPDMVFLQEIPVWALDSMAEWSGMQAITDRARKPKLGPFPIPASLGRALTAPNHGKIRSAFAGQGNAVLIPREATLRKHKSITLNTNPFCEERGRELGLTPKQMVDWEKERRICQTVQYELANRQRFFLANVHATHSSDIRLPDAELRKAVNFVLRGSELEEVLVVAGDFNITRDASTTINELMTAEREDRWMASGPQIDHILLRRAIATSVRVWPDDERTYDGKILSDHAPVEVQIELRPKS
jgi:endonuclease/exonuclease/phosphatase family metal-dependent hydrolase